MKGFDIRRQESEARRREAPYSESEIGETGGIMELDPAISGSSDTQRCCGCGRRSEAGTLPCCILEANVRVLDWQVW